MAENHLDTGKLGEELALAHLREKGYRILATNWRFRHLELDIVAMHENELVIVEVKTRSSEAFGTPQDFITKSKQKLLIRAANHYIEQFDFNGETRFDVISILLGNAGETELVHIESAFYPFV